MFHIKRNPVICVTGFLFISPLKLAISLRIHIVHIIQLYTLSNLLDYTTTRKKLFRDNSQYSV